MRKVAHTAPGQVTIFSVATSPAPFDLRHSFPTTSRRCLLKIGRQSAERCRRRSSFPVPTCQPRELHSREGRKTYDGDDLEVEGPEIHAVRSPGTLSIGISSVRHHHPGSFTYEVVLNRHRTAGARAATDRDVLVESRRALDRRLVRTSVLPDRLQCRVRQPRSNVLAVPTAQRGVTLT